MGSSLISFSTGPEGLIPALFIDRRFEVNRFFRHCVTVKLIYRKKTCDKQSQAQFGAFRDLLASQRAMQVN